ncbi:hypothetical protein [Mycoplasma sp. 4044]
MKKAKKLTLLVSLLSVVAAGASAAYLVNSCQDSKQTNKTDFSRLEQTLKEVKQFLDGNTEENQFQDLKNKYDNVNNSYKNYSQNQVDEAQKTLSYLLESAKNRVANKKQQQNQELVNAKNSNDELITKINEWINQNPDASKEVQDSLKQGLDQNLTIVAKALENKDLGALNKQNQVLNNLLDSVKKQSSDEQNLALEENKKLVSQAQQLNQSLKYNKDSNTQKITELTANENDKNNILTQKNTELQNLITKLSNQKQQEIDSKNNFDSLLNDANKLANTLSASNDDKKIEIKNNLTTELENIKQSYTSSNSLEDENKVIDNLKRLLENSQKQSSLVDYEKVVYDANSLVEKLKSSKDDNQALIDKINEALKSNEVNSDNTNAKIIFATNNITKATEDVKSQRQTQLIVAKNKYNKLLNDASEAYRNLKEKLSDDEFKSDPKYQSYQDTINKNNLVISDDVKDYENATNALNDVLNKITKDSFEKDLKNAQQLRDSLDDNSKTKENLQQKIDNLNQELNKNPSDSQAISDAKHQLDDAVNDALIEKNNQDYEQLEQKANNLIQRYKAEQNDEVANKIQKTLDETKKQKDEATETKDVNKLIDAVKQLKEVVDENSNPELDSLEKEIQIARNHDIDLKNHESLYYDEFGDEIAEIADAAKKATTNEEIAALRKKLQLQTVKTNLKEALKNAEWHYEFYNAWDEMFDGIDVTDYYAYKIYKKVIDETSDWDTYYENNDIEKLKEYLDKVNTLFPTAEKNIDSEQYESYKKILEDNGYYKIRKEYLAKIDKALDSYKNIDDANSETNKLCNNKLLTFKNKLIKRVRNYFTYAGNRRNIQDIYSMFKVFLDYYYNLIINLKNTLLNRIECTKQWLNLINKIKQNSVLNEIWTNINNQQIEIYREVNDNILELYSKTDVKANVEYAQNVLKNNDWSSVDKEVNLLYYLGGEFIPQYVLGEAALDESANNAFNNLYGVFNFFARLSYKNDGWFESIKKKYEDYLKKYEDSKKETDPYIRLKKHYEQFENNKLKVPEGMDIFNYYEVLMTMQSTVNLYDSEKFYDYLVSCSELIKKMDQDIKELESTN